MSATTADLDPEEQQRSDPLKEKMITVPCILCHEVFPFPANRVSGRRKAVQSIAGHLLTTHKLVIADIDHIADFPAYSEYWKERMERMSDLKEVCYTVRTNTGPDDETSESEEFLLLSPDKVAEESALRQRLTDSRLAHVLSVQKREREAQDFERMCLFCRKILTGNRCLFLQHLDEEHNFRIGAADDIVFVNELLDVIEDQLHSSLKCLFCENQFTEWDTLREHMRKKGHKQLNPENRSYDPFYLTNYLETGKTFRSPETISVNWQAEEEDTSDWISQADDEIGGRFRCLFCPYETLEIEPLDQHMDLEHDFNLQDTVRGLTFYQKVKLVNFIRKRQSAFTCFSCGTGFAGAEELLTHLKTSGHVRKRPEDNGWDVDEFLIPALDNDILLSFLPTDDDDDGNEKGKGGDVVTSEGITIIGEEIERIDLSDLPSEVQQLIQCGGR